VGGDTQWYEGVVRSGVRDISSEMCIDGGVWKGSRWRRACGSVVRLEEAHRAWMDACTRGTGHLFLARLGGVDD
jgi:hypothetical protein